jgi:hypothetical protein
MTKHSLRQDGRPAIQFYIDDWLSSSDVNSCSLAAQGLWMKMLCYMFQSPKRGVLLLPSGKQIESKTLAKLCGEDEQIVSKLLAELEEAGTFSRLDNQDIYCRRMKREGDITEARKEAGRLGGIKQKESKSEAIAKQMVEDEDEEVLSISIKEGDYKGKFNDLWKLYPNKDGKKLAERSFKASVKTEQDWQDINKAMNNYLQSDTVKKGFIKNGSTWFNNWRDWIDFTGISKTETLATSATVKLPRYNEDTHYLCLYCNKPTIKPALYGDRGAGCKECLKIEMEAKDKRLQGEWAGMSEEAKAKQVEYRKKLNIVIPEWMRG